MRSSIYKGNAAIFAASDEAHAKEDVQHQKDVKRGIQRLIVRQRMFRLIVNLLAWSFLPLTAALGMAFAFGPVPAPYFFVVAIAVVTIMVAFITAMKAKNIAIDVIDRLGNYPLDDWFVVLSVSRTYGESWPIVITLRDVIGGTHKVYFSGSAGKVNVDDLDNLHEHLAYLTRSRWKDVLEEMKKHDFPGVHDGSGESSSPHALCPRGIAHD